MNRKEITMMMMMMARMAMTRPSTMLRTSSATFSTYSKHSESVIIKSKVFA